MSIPQITIIVTVYNTEQYLHCCIDSILAQTFTDFELLLIDDGSKDTSGRICDEYAVKDSRVRVFHKKNGGVSSARNLGLDNATGNWILFVDSDDWLDKEMTAKLFATAIRHNPDIVYCDFYRGYSDNMEYYPAIEASTDKINLINNYIGAYFGNVLWNMLIRRELFDSYNLRCINGQDFCEDFYLSCLLYFHAKRTHHLHEALYFYRLRNDSVSHHISISKEKSRLSYTINLIEFFKRHQFYPAIKKGLMHRLIIAKDFYIRQLNDPYTYTCIYPESHQYIISHPALSIKWKVYLFANIKLTGLIKHLRDFIKTK